MKLSKKYYTLLLFYLFYASISCSKNKPGLYFDTQVFSRDSLVSSYLKGEVLKLDTLSTPVRIKLGPEYKRLFIINMMSSPLIDIIDIGKEKITGQFLLRGQGPNELLNTKDISFINRNILAVSGAPAQKKILYFSLDSILSNSVPANILPIKNLSLDVDSPPISPAIMQNGFIIDLNRNYEKEPERFTLYDATGYSIKTWGKYPTLKSESFSLNKDMFEYFYSAFDVNSSENLLVLSHFRTDLIELYDITTGQLKSRIQGPDFFIPSLTQKNLVPTKKSKEAYRFPVFGTDSFMVGYDGSFSSENNQDFKEVFLFNLIDKSITQLILDIPVYHFDVDWTKREIYALSGHFESKEFAVVRFKF